MAFALVQDDAVGTSYSLTFGSSCTSGNLVVVCFSAQDGGGEAATCTVGGVSAALIAAGKAHNASLAGGWSGWIFYLVLSASGAHEVVIDGLATGNERLTILEFSGNAAASVLDDSSVGSGNSTTPSSGNMDPTQAGDLIVGYAITQSGTIAAGSGFTSVTNVDGFDEAEYFEQGAAATIDADFTADSNQWLAAGAAFKGAGGGGGGSILLLVAKDLQGGTTDMQDMRG